MNADGLHWRLAARPDAAGLATLARDLFIDAFGADNTQHDMEQYVRSAFGEALQAQQILDPFWDTLLLCRGPDPVGYAQLDYGPAPDALTLTRPACIRRFYLDRDWHGSGAAALLDGAVQSAAAQRGARWLWLTVWEHNARAIAYYRKAGFEARGETSFMLGDDRQRDLLLVRASAG